MSDQGLHLFLLLLFLALLVQEVLQEERLFPKKQGSGFVLVLREDSLTLGLAGGPWLYRLDLGVEEHLRLGGLEGHWGTLRVRGKERRGGGRGSTWSLLLLEDGLWSCRRKDSRRQGQKIRTEETIRIIIQ